MIPYFRFRTRKKRFNPSNAFLCFMRNGYAMYFFHLFNRLICFTKFYFRNSGEGANMICSLLLATLLASTNWCFSQSEMCNAGEFTPLCNELGVKIKPTCFSDCIPDEASCRQLAFDVFLHTSEQMPFNGQVLCYQDLSVTLNVLSDQIPSFLRINADQSKNCSATVFGSSTLLEFDEGAGQAVWTNAGTSSHPTISFFPNNYFCSSLGNSAAYLFTIVVDVMPGENISVGCADLVYTRPETGTADYDQDGILECADVETDDEDPGTQAITTVLYCSPDTSTLPTPIVANPDITVVIEAPDLTGMPNGAMVPISLSSSLTTGTVTFLDFVVRLTVDQLMTSPLSSMQVSGFPLCVPLLNGEIKNYKTTPEPVTGVTVEVKRSNASNTCTMEPETDCYGFSTCICGYDEYDVTPMKTDGVGNGVSTFDLVLINKHILGIEEFDSPYKIIAADVNNSKSVTTIDIAELRKLILGIYDDSNWPGRNSWTFTPEDYVFPTPDMPFTPTIPEFILELDIQANSNIQANFVAIKTGDVNQSHVANDNCRPAAKNQQKSTAFRFESDVLDKSKTITYAFYYEGNEPLTAFQGGFRYDPQLLEFIGASTGDVEGITSDCFGLTRVADGEIRLVWLSPDMESHFLQPGQALCHFAFRTKGALRPEDQVLKLDDLVLEGEAIGFNNEVFRPIGKPISTKDRNIATQVSDLLHAEFVPNPLTGSGRMVIDSKEQGAARIMMFDAFGKRVGYHEFLLVKGTQEILLPETSQWPSGMYSWLLLIGSNRVAEGKVVKP